MSGQGYIAPHLLPELFKAIQSHVLVCTQGKDCRVCLMWDRICATPEPDTAEFRADAEHYARETERFDKLTTQGDD